MSRASGSVSQWPARRGGLRRSPTRIGGPGGFDLFDVLLRPVPDRRKWIHERTAQSGERIFHARGKRRDHLTADKAVTFKTPQHLCENFVRNPFDATVEFAKSVSSLAEQPNDQSRPLIRDSVKSLSGGTLRGINIVGRLAHINSVARSALVVPSGFRLSPPGRWIGYLKVTKSVAASPSEAPLGQFLWRYDEAGKGPANMQLYLTRGLPNTNGQPMTFRS